MITNKDIFLKRFSNDTIGYSQQEVDRYLKQLADEIDQLSEAYSNIRRKIMNNGKRPDLVSRDEFPVLGKEKIPAFSEEKNGYNYEEVEKFICEIEQEIAWLQTNIQRMQEMLRAEKDEEQPKPSNDVEIDNTQKSRVISREEREKGQPQPQPQQSNDRVAEYIKKSQEKIRAGKEEVGSRPKSSNDRAAEYIKKTQEKIRAGKEEVGSRPKSSNDRKVDDPALINNHVVTGTIDTGKKRTRRVLIIAFIIGICIFAAGISGRIIMGKVTEKVMSADFVGSLDKDIPGVSSALNRGMGRLSINLTVSLIKNDSSGFVKAIKDITKEIGKLADVSGIGELIFSPVFEELAKQAFEEGRQMMVDSAGAYMLLLTFAAYFHELLLIGGIIAGVSLLLWFLMGGKSEDFKNVKILIIIGAIWIIAITIMTVIALSSEINADQSQSAKLPVQEAIPAEDPYVENPTVALVNVAPTETVEEQYCGNNISWTYNDGVLNIFGEGEMYNYNKHMAPWDHYANSIEIVIISDGVTSIGEHAFYECTHLKSVSMPNSIKTIGISAFDRCRDLPSIIIPVGVTELGGWAFASCDALADVILPDGLQSIGERCFVDCNNLKSINIPRSISQIDNWAFMNSNNVVMTISENSYAVQYAKNNGIKYINSGSNGDSVNDSSGRTVSKSILDDIHIVCFECKVAPLEDYCRDADKDTIRVINLARCQLLEGQLDLDIFSQELANYILGKYNSNGTMTIFHQSVKTYAQLDSLSSYIILEMARSMIEYDPNTSVIVDGCEYDYTKLAYYYDGVIAYYYKILQK